MLSKDDDLAMDGIIMSFVLSDDFVTQLSELRKNYEKEASIDLEHAPQPYARIRFFGAKDIDSRKKQISFIEQWVNVFKEDLSEDNPLRSPKERHRRILALHVLISVCFYTTSQIDGTYSVRSGASAILEKLICKAMGVSKTNYIDNETKARCFLAAKHYLIKDGHLEIINAHLSAPIHEKQWGEFLIFITRQCDALDTKYKTNYPITSIMMPLVAKPLEFAGYATGYVFGDMIGKSSELLSTQKTMTALLGSCVFAIAGSSSGASLGVILFVPTCAGRIVRAFCGISLASLMGTALSHVGQGVGFGVGMSLDLSCKLLYNACDLLANLCRDHKKLTGTSLVSGHRIIEGVEFVPEDSDSIPEELSREFAQFPVEVEANETELKVTINGQSASFSWLEDKEKLADIFRKIFERQSVVTADSDAASMLTTSEDRETSTRSSLH